MDAFEGSINKAITDLSRSPLSGVSNKAVSVDRSLAQLRAHAAEAKEAAKKLSQYYALRARVHLAKLDAIDNLLSAERPLTAIARFERSVDDDARLTNIVSQNVVDAMASVQHISSDLDSLRHTLGSDPLFDQTKRAFADITVSLDVLSKDAVMREGLIQFQRALIKDLQNGKSVEQDLRSILAGMKKEREQLMQALTRFANLEQTGRIVADQAKKRAAVLGLISTESPVALLGAGGAVFATGSPLVGLALAGAAIIVSGIFYAIAETAKEAAVQLQQKAAEREKAVEAKLQQLYPSRSSIASRIKNWFS